GRGAVRRQQGNVRADDRARRIAALLACALVIQEKVAEFLFDHRSAEASTEDVLIDLGTGLTLAIQEEIVGVQNGVAEKLVSVAMELSCARFQNRIDVSAAVSPLAGVVQRSLDLELLNNVRIGERNVRRL